MRQFKSSIIPVSRGLPVGSLGLWMTNNGRIWRIKTAKGRWEVYSNWLWRQLNGRIPSGCLVVHADGDMTNDSPSNLQLILRRDLVQYKVRTKQGAERRRRKRAAAARKRRAALERAMKRARQQRQFSNPTQLQWECNNCGATHGQGGRCCKCGSFAVERIRVPLIRKEAA